MQALGPPRSDGPWASGLHRRHAKAEGSVAPRKTANLHIVQSDMPRSEINPLQKSCGAAPRAEGRRRRKGEPASGAVHTIRAPAVDPHREDARNEGLVRRSGLVIEASAAINSHPPTEIGPPHTLPTSSVTGTELPKSDQLAANSAPRSHTELVRFSATKQRIWEKRLFLCCLRHGTPE